MEITNVFYCVASSTRNIDMIEINRNKEIYLCILTSSISGKLFIQYKYFDMITRFVQSRHNKKECSIRIVYVFILRAATAGREKSKFIRLSVFICVKNVFNEKKKFFKKFLIQLYNLALRWMESYMRIDGNQR